MNPQQITPHLQTRFGAALQVSPPDAWQVETPEFRLLILLSADQSWLRVLTPIVSGDSARPYFQQILEANFDLTQQTRYALHQGVLWGVFQYELASLTETQLEAAITQLLAMQQAGVDPFFDALADQQLRQIIQVAKQQGQSLTETMQTLDRFYTEGMMGDMGSSGYQEQVLAAWRRQLERLWPEVD